MVEKSFLIPHQKHVVGSHEYQQHVFLWGNKKKFITFGSKQSFLISHQKRDISNEYPQHVFLW